jgi:glycosyltransferase involved in cell wall biosynthesis
VAYVDPWSVQEIARTLADLLADEDRRAELARRARARAAQFSWSAFAERVCVALEQAAVNPVARTGAAASG